MPITKVEAVTSGLCVCVGGLKVAEKACNDQCKHTNG